MHQAVLRLVDAAGEGYVFCGLIEMSLGIGCQAVNEIGFSRKLVREFLLRGHGSAMLSRGLGNSVIHLQRRKAGFGSFAVRHLEEAAFRLGVVRGGGLRICCSRGRLLRRPQWRDFKRRGDGRKNKCQRRCESTGHVC